MQAYFEAHWHVWLNELQIPVSFSDDCATEQRLHAELKQRQLNALQECLTFHLKSFPAGFSEQDVCDELNRGRFYSLSTVNYGAARVARQVAGSLFKDVLLAQGCWLENHCDWHVSQLYRSRFQVVHYFAWSDWIGGKPHGIEYLQRRGNQFFERFCGLQPVRHRTCPYVCDYRGAWDLKTHLALLTQGDYTDFLAKNKKRLPATLSSDVLSSDETADFENDECCQRAAAKLISAIRDDSLGTFTDEELSLLYLFLLGEEPPYQALADLTAKPAEPLLEEYNRLQKRIGTRLHDAITLHKFRCPCWKHFMGSLTSRGRCRCLAYVQHADWYRATHERLFHGQHQQLLHKFAQHCDSVLNSHRP